jgi:raffinose/stachyose/melibiose transport system permease protein
MTARRRSLLFAGLLAPGLLLYVVFVIAPMAIAIPLSAFAWDGQAAPTWLGLENWRRLLGDPATLHSIEVTFVALVVSWVLQVGIGLPLGIFLAGRGRFRAVLAPLYLLPMLFSGTAIAIGWSALLQPTFGLFRGISWLAHPWLGDVDTALVVVTAVVAWQSIPFVTLLFQVGVQQIPPALYEAAALDGASRMQQHRRLTVPLLRPTFAVSTLLILVGTLTYFGAYLIMTNGGPGDATRVLALHMYLKGFQEYQLGYANTLAVVLIVVGTLMSVVIVRLTGFGRLRSQFEGM